MAYPTLVVQIAWNNPPLATTFTWHDVSDRVRGHLTVTRGRINELDDVDAGRMNLTLKNSDRALDPTISGHDYPMKKIRFGLQWPAGTGTIYWRFVGYIEAWQMRVISPAEQVVDVRCVDASKFINMREIVDESAWPQEFTYARAGRVLDAVGWPAGDRTIFTSTIEVQPTSAIDTPALAHLQLVARTEHGMFYLSRTGNAAFRSRSSYDALGSSATLSNSAAGGFVRYSELRASFDDTLIYNQIRATRETGKEERKAEDSTSQTQYGTRTLLRQGLLFVDGNVLEDYCDLLLHRYRVPRLRPASVTIDPSIGDQWADVLNLDLGDRITIVQHQLTGTTPSTFDAHIEQFSESMSDGPNSYQMRIGLQAHIGGTPSAVAVISTSIWRPVTFEHGWSNAGGDYPPAGYWKDADGRVYLRGLVGGGTASPDEMFTLPVPYRPPYWQYFTVQTGSGPGRLIVQSDGDVILVTGSTGQVDLGSIRFLNH